MKLPFTLNLKVFVIGLVAVVVIVMLYAFTVSPIQGRRALKECLDMGVNGEVEGWERWALGRDEEKYVDYCFRLYDK